MTALRLPEIGQLEPARFDQVRALLQGAGLPIDDLNATRAPDFIVACDGARVVGAVALERHGDVALLRSLVVDPDYRRHGVGCKLVTAAEQRARALGIAQLVLLTQTAEAFFARRGYEKIARSGAPAAVQSSHEFATLCPASAVCMRKELT